MANDKYGRAVVLTTAGGMDVYTIGASLFELKFITGTSIDQVYNSINSMAPSGTDTSPALGVTEYKGRITVASDQSNPQITLPADITTGNTGYYRVGNNEIDVFLNGMNLSLGADFDEIGTAGIRSDKIQMNRDLVQSDVLEFKRK